MRMGEKDFWKIVKRMEYSKDYDIERIKEEFKTEIKDTNQNMFNTFQLLFVNLEKSMNLMFENNYITSYDESIGLNDSDLSDLLSNIIGMGKQEYYLCLNDYNVISNYAKGNFRDNDGNFRDIFN